MVNNEKNIHFLLFSLENPFTQRVIRQFYFYSIRKSLILAVALSARFDQKSSGTASDLRT